MNINHKQSLKLSLIVIVAIVFLEGIALLKGVDGKALAAALVIIAGAGGIKVGKLWK